MSFKEAISQRIISDYKIPTIAVSDERVARVIKENRILNLRLRDLDEAEARAVATGVALKRVEKQGVTAPCARTPSRCVPHVDDLVQPRAEQITRSCRLVLLRPHRSLRCGDRIMLLDSRESRKRIASFQGLRHGNLAISSQQSRQKTTLAQWVRNSSRATPHHERLDQRVPLLPCGRRRRRCWAMPQSEPSGRRHYGRPMGDIAVRRFWTRR